jgi:hypothetical protein
MKIGRMKNILFPEARNLAGLKRSHNFESV